MAGDEDHVDNQLAKLVPAGKQPAALSRSLSWMNLKSSRKLSYEEQQLRLQESFDPEAPRRKGVLVWEEKAKRWTVES